MTTSWSTDDLFKCFGGSQDSSRKHFYLVQLSFMLVSWHCFPLQFHFKLGNLFFFTLGLFYKNDKHDRTNRTLNFGIHTVWLVLKFYKIMILTTSKGCLHSVTKSQWVPDDFQGQHLVVYFSKILIAILQLVLSLRVARFHHTWTAQEKFIWKDKTRNILLSLRYSISFRTWSQFPHHSANMPEKAEKMRLHCSKRCLLLFKQSLFNNTYSHLYIFNGSIIFVICCNE